MAKYICLAFKPVSTPAGLCSQALNFPSRLLSPEATLKQPLLLSLLLPLLLPLLPPLPGPQAPVLGSLPRLLSLSLTGKEASLNVRTLSLLALVLRRVVPRASVLECGWTLLCLQLTPADACGISPTPQTQMLPYRYLSDCRNCQPFRNI